MCGLLAGFEYVRFWTDCLLIVVGLAGCGVMVNSVGHFVLCVVLVFVCALVYAAWCCGVIDLCWWQAWDWRVVVLCGLVLWFGGLLLNGC